MIAQTSFPELVQISATHGVERRGRKHMIKTATLQASVPSVHHPAEVGGAVTVEQPINICQIEWLQTL